jgi:hypothetical protein
MKSRGHGNSAAASYQTDSPPYTVPELATEMAARDRLTPKLRRALDYATREWSAAQALEIAPTTFDQDYLAAQIEAQSRQDHEARRMESLKCQPVKPTRNIVR